MPVSRVLSIERSTRRERDTSHKKLVPSPAWRPSFLGGARLEESAPAGLELPAGVELPVPAVAIVQRLGSLESAGEGRPLGSSARILSSRAPAPMDACVSRVSSGQTSIRGILE